MGFCFKAVLPVLQIVVAILVFTTNRNPEFTTLTGPPDAYHEPRNLPTGVTRFAEMNLPAIPLVAPIYLMSGGRDRPANTTGLIAAFGLVGIGIWFFVGQFLDYLAAVLQKRRRPRRHIFDALFSGFIIASSCMLLLEANIASFALSLEESTVKVAALSWLVFGCAALLTQVSWTRKVHTWLRSC